MGLDLLQIPEKKNIVELARQPLLLLMLALYDSVGNSLQKDQDLDQTQLYNKLIQRFIGREEKKNNVNFDEEDGAQVIEAEMERLGVTALGMYNRSSVHIRADQLEQDLNFLQVKPYSSKMKDEVRLLRRFFFIHSIEQGKKWNPKFGAYEFLHNSFGEFLTARYMVSLLPDVLGGSEPGKSWYAAMAYVPLYTRPNVAQMLRLWAAASQKFQRERVENWLKAELGRTLRGEAVSSLKVVSGGFCLDDDHAPKDLLVHTAIYACNLMCMGTLIMRQVEIERLETAIPGVWEKLVRLWQFGFGEDGMVGLSRVFKLTDSGCFMFDDCSEQRHKSDNRDGDLSNLYTNLMMEPECSLMAALQGSTVRSDAYKRMKMQRLPYGLTMVYKEALNNFAYNRWNNQSSETIYDVVRLLNESSAKKDKGTRAGIYMMLKQCLESHPDVAGRVLDKMVGKIWEIFERAQTPMMRRLIAEVLLLMPEHTLGQLDTGEIIAHFKPQQWERPAWEYYDGARVIAHLFKNTTHIGHSLRLLDFLEMPKKMGFAISVETVPYIVFIIEQMGLGAYSIHEPSAAIDTCIHALENSTNPSMDTHYSKTVADLFCVIWGSIWINTENFRLRIWGLAEDRDISMQDIYMARPECVDRMCQHELESESNAALFRRLRLFELIEQCPEDLTIKHYGRILDLASQTQDNELLEVLKQINR